MKEQLFKTNINCGGCVSTLIQVLNAIKGVCEWSLGTANLGIVLTIKTESLSASEVIVIRAKMRK